MKSLRTQVAQVQEKDAQIAALERRLGQMEKRLEQVSEQVEQSKATPIPAANVHGQGGM
jgi:type II secretory pathway component PulJ